MIHQSARIATFQPDLERLFPADAHGVRAIPPRDLSALALAHRHPWTESLFMGGDTFNISSHLYWRLPGGAYLAHGWHLCIPFLHPQRLPASPFWSIDNDYTNQVIDDPGTLEVVEDSDHITFVEVLVEQAPRYWRPQECSFTPLRYALGMEGLFQSEHSRLLVRHGVAQHGGPPEAHWADVRKEARDTVDDILHWDAFLRGASSASLSPRQQRAASHEIDRLHDQISTLENRLAQGGAEGHPRQLTYLWANLGKLHCSLAQTAEAARAMARVLEVCGTNAHAALRIARAAGQWGYPDLRRRAVRRVSELDPSLLEQSGIELA